MMFPFTMSFLDAHLEVLGRVPWNRHHMEPTTRSHETPKHPMDGLRAGGIHCLSVEYHILPSCKRLHNYGKSPFSIGKSTIINGQLSIATSNYQRVHPRKGRKQLLQAALANSSYCKIHQNPTFCWPYKPPVIPLPKIHTEKGHPLLQLSGSCLSWDQRIRSLFYWPPLDLLGSGPRKSKSRWWMVVDVPWAKSTTSPKTKPGFWTKTCGSFATLLRAFRTTEKVCIAEPKSLFCWKCQTHHSQKTLWNGGLIRGKHDRILLGSCWTNHRSQRWKTWKAKWCVFEHYLKAWKKNPVG